MPADDLIALAIWQEADECSSALSARAAKFIAAMEFQDLASQHINHSVDAIETVRARLSAVLEYFGLTVTGEHESTDRPRSLAVLGRADQVHGERQAAADEIIAGLR
jgi:chemotaxis regulatin CheY-phosphate phosphatase CheZ